MSSLGPWEVCRFLDFPGPVKACASEGSGSKLDRRKMFAEAKTAEDAEFGAARGDEPPAALRGRANRRRRFAKAKQLLDQELEEQRRAHEAHLAERAAKEAERGAKPRGRKPRWPNRTAVTTGPPAYAATRPLAAARSSHIPAASAPSATATWRRTGSAIPGGSGWPDHLDGHVALARDGMSAMVSVTSGGSRLAPGCSEIYTCLVSHQSLTERRSGAGHLSGPLNYLAVYGVGSEQPTTRLTSRPSDARATSARRRIPVHRDRRLTSMVSGRKQKGSMHVRSQCRPIYQ